MAEFNVGQKFVVEIAQVYRAESRNVNGRKASEYVYRMKGDIPLMRERQLKLLERIEE